MVSIDLSILSPIVSILTFLWENHSSYLPRHMLGGWPHAQKHRGAHMSLQQAALSTTPTSMTRLGIDSCPSLGEQAYVRLWDPLSSPRLCAVRICVLGTQEQFCHQMKPRTARRWNSRMKPILEKPKMNERNWFKQSWIKPALQRAASDLLC